MRKKAIIFYGPPGSGKGTQANLLARKFDLIHFDTGKFLEALVHDPARQDEKIVQRERKLFDAGILLTPSFVLREVTKATKRIEKAGFGVIFSGSPRTMYEAEGFMPILEHHYGKENIFVFELCLPAHGSTERNVKRLVCSVCGYTLLSKYYPTAHPKYCPVCAGPFYKRTLDNADVITIRLKEYRERTEPIFGFLKKRGYAIRVIDATPAPYKIFLKLNDYIENA